MKPEDTIANFKSVLQSLVQSKKLNIRKCDDILNQFSEFTTSDAVAFNFEKFSQCIDRLDTLYYDAIITWSGNGGTQLLCQQGCF